jgi:hypothetical protein
MRRLAACLLLLALLAGCARPHRFLPDEAEAWGTLDRYPLMSSLAD